MAQTNLPAAVSVFTFTGRVPLEHAVWCACYRSLQVGGGKTLTELKSVNRNK